MGKPMRAKLMGLAAALCAVAGQAQAQSAEERAAQARAIARDFSERLRSELVAAIEAGGPQAAIAVCHTAAPAIAAGKSAETGWSVGRTALRLRNPANAPDAWERLVLQDFLAKAKAGADLQTLEHYETVSEDGRTVFRYMKAIPTQQPCLTCHGPAVDPALLEKITALYPQDAATGFALGELRGAFTIVQPMQ